MVSERERERESECVCAHVSEASSSLTAPLCQSLFQWLSVNVSFCTVVYSDVSLLNEIKANSTVFQYAVLWMASLMSHTLGTLDGAITAGSFFYYVEIHICC